VKSHLIALWRSLPQRRANDHPVATIPDNGGIELSENSLHPRERSTNWVIRLYVGFALLFGRRVARLMLYVICLYFVLFSVRSRAGSRKYVSRVLGRPARLRDVWRHYFAFASVTLDRVYLLKNRVDLFQVETHGEECLDRIAKNGTGCLLLGAHLGSFEILRACAAAKRRPLAFLMYDENARKVNTIVKAINPALAQEVIELGRLDSMLKVHERLSQNEWIGMLGDRTLHNDAYLTVPFLGEDACFPTAAFRVALMLKRPIVLMLGVYRGGSRYDLYFEPLFDPQSVDRADRNRRIDEALRYYVQRLEHHCRDAPYNWFNFYDFWDRSSHA
jgi:predicted LPLAT superfamily acyltransferase